MLDVVTENPWLFAIVSGVVASVVFAVLVRVTKWGARFWRWLRSWRFTNEPRLAPKANTPAADLPWVAPPRWDIRQHVDAKDGEFGLFNIGTGDARDVHLWAESDGVVVVGVVDYEVVLAGEGFRFTVLNRPLGGLGDTWLVVSAKDANGSQQQATRLKIAGPVPF